MKSISIKQPYAGLICEAKKTIEVRSWQTHYRGNLLICASQKPDLESGFNITFEKYPYINGHAICIAELYKIEPFMPEHENAAFCGFDYGYFAWHLRNIQLIEPFKVKGKLNFFHVEI